MSPADFTVPSFAKINWVLRVLGRRTDGFHELSTIFQTISLQDRLTFTARDDDRLHLTCNSPEIPSDESNLILRAGRALRERYGSRKGASIHLEKNIPVEAGLGGGSSNAAIALLGLAHLWRVEIDKQRLEGLGAQLGADVPFFFTGGTALGVGLGTRVEPLGEVAARRLIVIKPEAKISTAEAYKSLGARALTKADSDTILSISRADAQFKGFHPDALHNDFEPVVFQMKPEIERAKSALVKAGATGALLAGSGSSVFGVFDNQETQERAFESVSEERRWRVFRCMTLTQGQYLSALGECAAPLLNRS
ncbi:MAG TPA: 4-(cytidine 5'-diphospho)-2-C-methyl-D-erythritol kinase [Pyrinomonadaceae bacterium]|nr:4-(cytidine 5'-diphospho)-2-C-methyl-D-erythritol kinase [Pyrinomonadaceae bacterium]